MVQFKRFEEEIVPQGGQGQVGFSPNRVADIGQVILDQYRQGQKANEFSDISAKRKSDLVSQNADMRNRNTKAYYDSMSKLVEFSETINTVTKYATEKWKENQKTQAQIEVLNEVWNNGASDDQKNELQSIRAVAREGTSIRADAADQSIKETGNTDIARWINNDNPWRAMYRAEALAVAKQNEYPAYLEDGLTNSEDELPGFGKTVREAQGAVERRAAVAYLRGKYWQESGLSIINPALLDEKLFPAMKKAEGISLSAKIQEDRIVLDANRKDEILSELAGYEDVSVAVRELSQLTGPTGKPIGPSQAWTAVKTRLSMLYSQGLVSADQLKSWGNQPDPVVKGKTIAQARPGFARDIVADALIIQNADEAVEDRDRRIQGEAFQQQLIEGFKNEDGTYRELTAEEELEARRAWGNSPFAADTPSLLDNHFSLYGPTADIPATQERFDNMMRNGVPFTEAMVRKQLPSNLWNQYLPYAQDNQLNKAVAAATKPYIDDLSDRVLKQHGLSTSNDPRVAKSHNALSLQILGTFKSEYAKAYNEAQRANPDGNPKAWAAAAAAKTDEFIKSVSQGNEKEEFLKDQRARLQQYQEPSAAGKEWNSKLYGAIQAHGDKALDVPGLLYSQAELQKIQKQIQEGTYIPDWKMQQTLVAFGRKPINEVLTRMLQAYDPNAQLIPPTPTTQAMDAAPPEVRRVVYGGPSTTTSYSRAVGQLNLGDGTYNNRAPMIRGEDPNPYIIQAGQTYDIPPSIIASLLEQESSYADDVIFGSRRSSAGAIGIAQFLPGTAAQMGIDPYDWKQSIDGAAKYLRHLMDSYGFDLETAIYAYNAGPGTVLNYGKGASPENAKYFPEIQRRAREKYRSILLKSYSYGNLEALNDPVLLRQNFVI